MTTHDYRDGGLNERIADVFSAMAFQLGSMPRHKAVTASDYEVLLSVIDGFNDVTYEEARDVLAWVRTQERIRGFHDAAALVHRIARQQAAAPEKDS